MNGQPVSTRATRLLIVANVPGMIRSFLLPYADHFRAAGWRVDAATSSEGHLEALSPHFDHVWEMPWSRRPGDLRNLPSGVLAMNRLLRRERYDLVHTHAPIASVVTRLAVATSRPARRPAVVYTAHGFHFGASDRDGVGEALYAAAERVAGRWTDRLVVMNPVDVVTAQRMRLVRRGALRYMPGIGLDLDWYRPAPQIDRAAGELRTKLGLRPEDILLSMLANLTPVKNHRAAVEAMSRLPRRDVHLALAGDGPLRNGLESLAAGLGVADRVHFLGHVDDVRPVIRASAATVLPSAREGMSRAVLESLAMDTPVIGTDVRGITEVVEPDGGALVPLGDIDALAAVMTKVADDPDAFIDVESVRRRMAEYAIARLVDRHRELYQELLPIEPLRGRG